MFILFAFSTCEEIDRSPRGLDSSAFRALLNIGNFISKIGIENFEDDLRGAFKLISHNIFIFYFLLIALITSQMLTFTLTMIALRGKNAERKPSVPSVISLDPDVPYDTNDRDYWVSAWV